MKALLYPAIALMNRLGFAAKFSLISVLFFLPMVLISGSIVRDAYNDFVHTRTELASLDLLSNTLLIRKDLELYYDLVQVNMHLGQSGQATSVEGRVLELEQQLLNQVQALQLPASDAQQTAEFDNKRAELQQSLNSLQSETSLLSKVSMAEAMLSKIQHFIRYVATNAGISTDQDSGVRQLVELISSSTPRLTQAMGQSRAVGSYSLGLGFLSSSDSARMDDLLLVLERIHSEYQVRIAEVFADVPQAEARLGGVLAQSSDALKEALNLLENDIVVAEALDTPWERFFEQTTDLIAKTEAVNQSSMVFLQQQLSERLSKSRLAMLGLISIVLLVLVLIAYLYSGFYVSVRGSLKDLGLVMNRVAQGDMTVRYHANSQDELGQLGRVFNETVANIRTLIERVGQTVGEVERQADRVEVVSGESNQAVSQQMGQIDQVATAMNQMSATAQEVARSAASAVDSAQHVNQETLSGRLLVESQVGSIQRLAGEIDSSVSVINQLAADSTSISQVLDVIKGIAEQTNLLALNAAIEAARAGEQGRGFAVVADEVRNLAKRTQQSTAEIESMIARLQSGVGAAVKAMNGSHQMADGTVSESAKVQLALENILGAVGAIVDQNQQIAAAAEEQTAVAQDIDQNIVQINRSSERTSEGAGQTEQASRELSHLVGQLKQLIGAFRV